MESIGKLSQTELGFINVKVKFLTDGNKRVSEWVVITIQSGDNKDSISISLMESQALLFKENLELAIERLQSNAE